MSLITNIMGPTITPLMGIKQAINWVAQLNGDGQYWQLSEPFLFEGGDVVRVSVGLPSSELQSFPFTLASRNNAAYAAILRLREGGIVEQNGAADIFIDGIEYSNGDAAPLGRGIYDYEFTVTGTVPTRLLTATHANIASGSTTWRLSGFIYDYEVIRNGFTVLKIPLTNKAQGATQLATVGNVNATMIGYSEDVWVKESDL